MPSSQPRPRSPDVQIYKPQLTSVLSIAHRATGVLLSAGSVLLVAWLVAVADGSNAYAALDGFLRSWIGIILLVGWTFSLFYHLCNGIRHLFWDAGIGFEIKEAEKASYIVIAVAVIATVASWAVGLRLA